MVAAGLLLPAVAVGISARPETMFARELAGQGRTQSQSVPVAQKTGVRPDPVAPEAGLQAADPVRIRIPAIGVDAPVQPLAVDRNGVLPPPDTDEGTGWWRDGPEPGERGPAVIVGHVDSYTGPAVFVHLEDLARGDRILVDRADGSTVVFAALRTESHPKDAFPTRVVYGATADAELRLVTCGGAFDDDDRRYLDNVIVYAARSG